MRHKKRTKAPKIISSITSQMQTRVSCSNKLETDMCPIRLAPALLLIAALIIALLINTFYYRTCSGMKAFTPANPDSITRSDLILVNIVLRGIATENGYEYIYIIDHFSWLEVNYAKRINVFESSNIVPTSAIAYLEKQFGKSNLRRTETLTSQ